MNNHSQRFINILEHFLDVGENLINGNDNRFTLNKMDYFMNLALLFLVYLILYEKRKKNLFVLNKMLRKHSSIISQNNHLFLMLLLSITEYESENFNFNYSDIMFYMREFNYEKLKNQKNYDENSLRLSGFSFRDDYLSENNDIPRLYLDIINKTLDYVIRKNKIILENNIDLLIMDNIYYFFSKYNTS
jgi:hypothetical protein